MKKLLVFLLSLIATHTFSMFKSYDCYKPKVTAPVSPHRWLSEIQFKGHIHRFEPKNHVERVVMKHIMKYEYDLCQNPEQTINTIHHRIDELDTIIHGTQAKTMDQYDLLIAQKEFSYLQELSKEGGLTDLKKMTEASSFDEISMYSEKLNKNRKSNPFVLKAAEQIASRDQWQTQRATLAINGGSHRDQMPEFVINSKDSNASCRHLIDFRESIRQKSYNYQYYDLQKLYDEKLKQLQSGNKKDAMQLREELRIIKAEITNCKGRFLADLAHKEPAEAMKSWAKLQALYSAGKLGPDTWERAQSKFNQRRSLQAVAKELEERTSVSKAEQEKSASKTENSQSSDQELVFADFNLKDPAEKQSVEPENKFKDTTDMTTQAPLLDMYQSNDPFRERFFDLYYEIIQNCEEVGEKSEQQIFYEVHQQMAREGLISEKSLLEESPELMSEMAKGFAEGVNPVELAKDTVELGKAVLTGTGRAVIYQITTSEEDKQKDTIEFLEHTLAAWQQLDLSKMSRKKIARTTGHFMGQLAAGKLMAKGAKFATGVIRKGAEVLSEVAESSKTSKAVTVEGVAVTAPQAAEDTSILKSAAEKMKGRGAELEIIAKSVDSVEHLIENAGKLTRLKKGVRQGFVQGDAKTIFNNLAKRYGAEIQKNAQGLPYFVSEKIRVYLTDSSAKIPTLRITIDNKLYKIRIP